MGCNRTIRGYTRLMPTVDERVRYLSEWKGADTPLPMDEPWSADAAEEAFKLLESRWKMMILFHLFDKGRLRFSELERAIPLVSQKMLIQQLRDLEAKGIVGRTVFQEVPPKVVYCLTELGVALRPALDALVRWASLRQRTSVVRGC